MKNQDKIIKNLLYKGLNIRTGLFIFGLICGILVGPGFSILGIILGGNNGPLFFSMGIIMTLLMIALIWLMYRENKDKQVILKSINSGQGIDKIYLVKILPQGAGAEGITARKLLKPFYHIFINHQQGYSVRFCLPKNDSFKLFTLLMEKFPQVKHSCPQEYLSGSPENKNLLSPQQFITQNQANSEMTKAEIKRIKKVR
ncbi:MAG: hypothetical protein ACP5FK_07190 [bacterium]